MANYDAGHYFLTVMAPLDRDRSIQAHGWKWSAIDHVRHVLAMMPTAQQDIYSDHTTRMSPFAAVPGTHFAHVFVIDDVRYNGRRPSNAILDLIFNVQMTLAEKTDSLPYAYVVLAVDFDAIDGSPASLRAWTDSAWRNMGKELQQIFETCEGFDAVKGEDSFFSYVQEYMVETTMPFNDYWTQDPPPRNPYWWMLGGSIAVLAAAFGAFWAGWIGLWPAIGLGLLALVLVNIAIILWYGLTPFPAAPESDLESVLKALYVQQMFTAFAIENLGKSNEDLAAAFDRFCETHAPGVPAHPSQPPGVLISERKTP